MPKIFEKAPRGLAKIHSEVSNQIPQKSRMQYVSEGTLPLFSSDLFRTEFRGCKWIEVLSRYNFNEKKYKGKLSPALLADLCWNLKHDIPEMFYKKRSIY